MTNSCCLNHRNVNPKPTFDPDWCRHLFEEMAPKLVLYGRAMGLSHGEGEDVVQDLFIQLLKRAEMPDNPTHYCLRAFRNRVLNYRKSLWRRITRELESISWFELDSAETDPREFVAMRCLRELPTEQREVVVLKIWHQMTFAAIAEMLGLSPNTVAGRYRYGLEKLRRLLREIDEDQWEVDGESYALLGAASGVKQA